MILLCFRRNLIFIKIFVICVVAGFGDFFEPTGRYKNADIFRHRVRYRYFARTREHLGYTFEGCSAIRHCGSFVGCSAGVECR